MQEFLGFGLDKSEQRSDWGNVDLSKEQLYYAALDAWSGYGIIEAMFKRYGKNVGQVGSRATVAGCWLTGQRSALLSRGKQLGTGHC